MIYLLYIAFLVNEMFMVNAEAKIWSMKLIEERDDLRIRAKVMITQHMSLHEYY